MYSKKKKFEEKNQVNSGCINGGFFVINKKGEYLASTLEISDAKKAEMFNRSAIIAAISGDDVFELYKEKDNNDNKNEILSYAMPVESNNQIKWVINTRINTNSIKEASDENRMVVLASPSGSAPGKNFEL